MKIRLTLITIITATFSFFVYANRPVKPSAIQQLVLPQGFQINLYAKDITGARQLARSPSGVVYVGSRGPGKVYALIPSRDNTHAKRVIVIKRGLNHPNGVAFHQGDLYVAEINRILVFRHIEKDLDHPPTPEVITDRLPSDRHHGWKFIAFGPDGHLYVPVGAPCNICLRQDERYATILRMHHEDPGFDIFARGVRNSVGFDWQPETDVLWFTDNGRDWLGDDLPPDELNRAPRAGLHFGYPYRHGHNIVDPDYGHRAPKIDFTAPAQELGPHVAALGMRFYTGTQFPKQFRNSIFIAEHGSWNRTKKIGYRISMVQVDGDKALRYQPFITGWLQGQYAWGRPVDVLVLQDGSLLISDDKTGWIYRVSYQSSKPA